MKAPGTSTLGLSSVFGVVDRVVVRDLPTGSGDPALVWGGDSEIRKSPPQNVGSRPVGAKPIIDTRRPAGL